MHSLERQIRAQLIETNISSDNKHVIIVGVSGGPDSVALLHILVSLQVDMNLSLVGVYIDHGLRPDEARKEVQHVRVLCEKCCVPFECVAVDVHASSKKEKKSLEHAARELRYQALRKIMEQYDGDLIATGHTADDQAEEILIRLLRGSGRKGMSGMAPRSGVLIRPLLHVRKEELIDYLTDKGVSYCHDSSNDDMRFLRNRVRHRLLPYLEKNFDAGVRNAMCKTAESLAEDEELLQELTERAFVEVVSEKRVDSKTGLFEIQLDRRKFNCLSKALQRRVAEELLWQMQSKANYSHIIKIITTAMHGVTGKEIHLSRGLRIGVERTHLRFIYPKGQKPWRGKLFSAE